AGMSVEETRDVLMQPAAGGERAPAADLLHPQLIKVLLTTVTVIALLVLWQMAVSWFGVPPYILPSPMRVLEALRSGLLVPLDSPQGFYLPIAHSLENAALGFLAAAVVGIVLGSLMAEFRPIETMLMPYTFALQSLPKVALAPLVVIWCGFGDGSKVTMSALLAFFPMLVNTFTGIRSTEPERIDLMRSLSASRVETYL